MPDTVTRYAAKPNPAGIGFGFWPNYTKQDLVFTSFGRRPYGRADFTGWNKIETAPGVYSWKTQAGKSVFANCKRSHLFGETVIGCINVSFSREISKTKQTIPDFYTPRITDPKTRAAAKRFLAAYTKQLIAECGTLYLAIDYEIIFNYMIFKPGGAATAKEWSDWYVEAAAAVRAAAKEAGHPGAIKLVPIVNGAPFKSDLLSKGRAGNQWLVDVVNVSDYLGMDIYECDPAHPADPANAMKLIEFWTKEFAGDKQAIVCENGFSAVTDYYPKFTAYTKNKYAGTEAQQKEYFENLFKALYERTAPGGSLAGRLTAFNFWTITDNYTDKKSEYEIYFGLIRKDGSQKPAFAAVRDGIARIESDPARAPYRIDEGHDVKGELAGQGAPLIYTSGTDFEFLRCAWKNAAPASKKTFHVKLAKPGGVLVHVNNGAWLYNVNMARDVLIDLGTHLATGENTIDIYCTGESFPAQQTVLAVSIE